jgi:hypothetical protein
VDRRAARIGAPSAWSTGEMAKYLELPPQMDILARRSGRPVVCSLLARGPIVYRLGHQVFILESGVRLPVGLPLDSPAWGGLTRGLRPVSQDFDLFHRKRIECLERAERVERLYTAHACFSSISHAAAMDRCTPDHASIWKHVKRDTTMAKARSTPEHAALCELCTLRHLHRSPKRDGEKRR